MLSRSPMLTDRRAFLGAMSLTPLAGIRQDTGSAPLSIRDFGCTGDGQTDDRAAFAKALDAARRFGRPLFVPNGIYVIDDVGISRGGEPLRLSSGMKLMGSGPASVIRFRRTSHQSFFGLGVEGNDIAVANLVLEVENGEGAWTAAVCAIGPVYSLRFAHTAFRGRGARRGCYGFLVLNADIAGLSFETCRFENLDLGFSKQTSDVSTQTRIRAVDCVGVDCTEVFEFNSPGIFLANVRAGSHEARDIASWNRDAFAIDELRAGMIVRSPFFAPGTRVATVRSERKLEFSTPALASSGTEMARFSAGGCRDGSIERLRVARIGQWGVGFSNCENWTVDISGEKVGYELVHIEDGSRTINVQARGRDCNLKPGVLGSPGAANGMVHISTGSRDISVRFDPADLRAPRPAAGLCVQPGGIMGTTGREVGPANIRVSGQMLMDSGAVGVIAYSSTLIFEDLLLDNPAPSSRADPMVRLGSTTSSGRLRVRRPGKIIVSHFGAPASHTETVEVLSP